MLRIGTPSSDFRPSHNTIALALLAVMRATTPRLPVQSNLPGRLLLLKAAATRAVSFTRSPRLIIFNPLWSNGQNAVNNQQRNYRLQYPAVPMRGRNTFSGLELASQ
jgi:hypothetical protein